MLNVVSYALLAWVTQSLWLVFFLQILQFTLGFIGQQRFTSCENSIIFHFVKCEE